MNEFVNLQDALREATIEYQDALSAFDYADDEFIEIANDRITAAKLNLDAIIKKTKVIHKLTLKTSS